MNNQTKPRVSPETLTAYILGSLVASMILVAIVIAVAMTLSGNFHLAEGQL